LSPVTLSARNHLTSELLRIVPAKQWVQEHGWVGERRVASEAAGEPSRGGHTSENAGMSSERRVRNPSAE